MLPECWAAEVCKGFDARLIARAMIERGWMEPGDGKNLATDACACPVPASRGST